MDRRKIKFLLLGLGVAGTMALMLALGFGKSEGLYYYYTVSEFLDTRTSAEGRYRVNGKVEVGSIDRLPGGQDVRFVMTDATRRLPVAYRGIIPDTFVDGADVVVQGRLQDGTFQAQVLLAKCPSKYEAADTTETREIGGR